MKSSRILNALCCACFAATLGVVGAPSVAGADQLKLKRSFGLRGEPLARVRVDARAHDRVRAAAERLAELEPLPVDEEGIARAVDYSRLENMKKLERTGALSGDVRFGAGSSGSQDGFKVRQGRVGGFREAMSDDDAAYCSQYMSAHLDPRYGYGT